MQSPVQNNAIQDIKLDLETYISGLELLNKEAAQILFDFYELYLTRGPKPWFGEKVDFEKFLNKITKFTTLQINSNGNSVVPFMYVAPKTYSWGLNTKKLAKLTGSVIDEKNFSTKVRIIKLACVEMFYMTCIRETYSTIKHIDMYGTNFLVDLRIANLHRHALESTGRMKLFGILK